MPHHETKSQERPSQQITSSAIVPAANGIKHAPIVDDACDTLEMLRVFFESRGFETCLCESAAEVLRIAPTLCFDIIVSDIGIPNIDGYELIRRLRQMFHLRHVPGIALTGYAAQKDAEMALVAGFDAHIPKPVDPGTLWERAEQLMNLDK